jgi:hypothetical protein
VARPGLRVVSLLTAAIRGQVFQIQVGRLGERGLGALVRRGLGTRGLGERGLVIGWIGWIAAGPRVGRLE